MFNGILPIIGLALLGWGWQRLAPAWLPVAPTAKLLNNVLLYLFAPALIFSVLATAELGNALWRIPVAGIGGILTVLLLAAMVYRLPALRQRLSPPQRGALILAAPFANGSISLPVCLSLYGDRAMQTVFLLDLLATAPLVWTLGTLLAHHYRDDSHLPPGQGRPNTIGRELLLLPPLWAAAAGLFCNLTGTLPPAGWLNILGIIGRIGIPLMVIVIGLSLNLGAFGRWRQLAPALVMRCLLAPLVTWLLAVLVGLEGQSLAVLVLASASASPVVGIILAWRYRLDQAIYGATLSMSIVLYLLLAPLYARLLA